MRAEQGTRRWVEAKIIHADGTETDLGVIATSDPDGPGTMEEFEIQSPEEEPDGRVEGG